MQVAEQFKKTLGIDELWTLGQDVNGEHESIFLSIDSSLALNTLGWKILLTVDESIEWTCEWYREYHAGSDMSVITDQQINNYINRAAAPI